ncbi:MAG: hypothetical protein QXT28_12610 [Thermofilaceae archaeon]
MELALVPAAVLLSAPPVALFALVPDEERAAAGLSSASFFATALSARLALEAGTGVAAGVCFAVLAFFLIALLALFSEHRRAVLLALLATIPASTAMLASAPLSTVLVPFACLTELLLTLAAIPFID